MSETSIDEIITEEAFAKALAQQSEMLFRLANSLGRKERAEWTRRHLYQLVSEADGLESFLDDHGARDNRTFHHFRELVASVRGLAMAGFSLRHLHGRLSSYGTTLELQPDKYAECSQAVREARDFVEERIGALLQACREEGRAVGLTIPGETFPSERYMPDSSRRRLPRNVGEEMIEDEEQKIAEVASKFLQVAEMFEKIGVRRIGEESGRESYLAQHCTEEQARVYEATVHNLQSAYDTHIKNTVLESDDDRLPRLRGHASAALHLLEAVTQLAHFVERHEASARHESSAHRIDEHVKRSEVREVTLNKLLYWACTFIELARPLAEDLLPSYTNVQELEVELASDVVLHARPMSLIVRIVNYYGTPVEMQVGDRACNAGSIMDLMVSVGTNAGERRFIFRGDENPLRDIGLLFESGLGEEGLSALPAGLSYLRDE